MIKKITGYWWLPDNPNKKCYGILKIFYSKRSTLEVKGIFTKKDDWSMFINPEFILGESDKGEKITLFSCSEYRCSPSDSYFHINTVFIGSYFDEEGKINFTNIFVEYQYLSDWFVKKNTLDIKHYKNGKTIFSHEPQKSKIVRLSKNDLNFQLKIMTDLSGGASPGAGSSFNYKEKTIIEIKQNKKKITKFKDIKNIILSLQDLFSIIIQMPSYPIMIFGECNFKENRPLNPLIYIYFPLRGEPDTEREFDFRSTLFFYREVEDNIKNILKNWFENEEKLKPVYKLYLASLYDHDMYLEYKFLSLVQAIEAYHRIKYGSESKYIEDDDYKCILEELKKRSTDIMEEHFREVLFNKLEYGNEYSLAKRFKMLFKEYFIKIFKVPKPNRNRFICKVVKTRNYLVHQDKKLSDISFHDEEYINANIILKTLIEVILLKELGFENKKIKIFYQTKIKHNNLVLKFN